MGFDRKEDFRSSFKEDRKSNEAPKKCQKQGEAAQGRTAAAMATHGRASDCAWAHSRSCVIAQPCRAPATRSSFFLRLFNCFRLGFWGLPSLLLGAL